MYRHYHLDGKEANLLLLGFALKGYQTDRH